MLSSTEVHVPRPSAKPKVLSRFQQKRNSGGPQGRPGYFSLSGRPRPIIGVYRKSINGSPYPNPCVRRTRELHTVEIRHKHTKEIVDLEELVGSTTEQRNWRGILIALLVIITVFGLIIAAIILVLPKEIEENIGEKLTYRDFIRHTLEPRHFQPVWTSDEVVMYKSVEGSVVQFNVADNSTHEIMDNSTFRELNTQKYHVSSDGKFVLLPFDIKYLYRHSFLAKYKIYNVDTRIHRDLKSPAAVDGSLHDNSLQYVTWSPDGQSLIAVLDNNMYYLKDAHGNEYEQLTFNGVHDVVYNGIPDWLYEEEILHSQHAIWWSGDGAYIVYGHFDDTQVLKYNMTIYGQLKNNYVENKGLSYPKAGTTNPKATLKVYNFEKNTTVDIKPPDAYVNEDHYFTSVVWQDATHVLVTWLNRPQNASILTLCDVTTGACYDNWRVVAEQGWLDMSMSPVLSPSGDSYYLMLSQKNGAAGSFKHIAKVNINIDNKQELGTSIFITAGELEVRKIVGYDHDSQIIYYLAIDPSDPTQRHLYSATTDKEDEDFRVTNCITCDLDPQCLYVDATFSGDGKTYVLSCKGPGVPYHQLMAGPDKLITMLDDNEYLRQTLVGKSRPKVEFIKVPIEDEQYVWVKLLLPQILKKSEILKYSLLMKVYGSPNTQLVTQEFDMGWETYQCSGNDLIIAYVDGRGSGGRGDDWLYAVHKHLGTLEVEDTLAAARYLKTLKYVDDKTAIWGVSHGGFMTSAVLANPNNVLSCGIAVAPVTDWRYYDTFYTERYMGLPTDDGNRGGYNDANISHNAANFKKSQFMIVHGTGDDNVHFQQSAQLIKALTQEDIYFKTLIYTDEQHWLNGGNTRNHLFNSMEDFIFQCYNKPLPRFVQEVVIEEEEEE